MIIRRLGKKRRWASAAVEMAVVTPLLLTLLFGIIEYGWTFFVRQSMVNAAREGARVAALPGSTDQQIRDRVTEYLTPAGLTAQVTLQRAVPPDNPTEKVTVTIPYAQITLLGAYFGRTDYNLISSCSMRKEGMD
jgi:Flp pilus assembly protein TadG